ncbi:hypothetical protein C8F04DRAFT_1254459 [Mycena alexandri]|uniref:Uncharacterized protein n=1 Tax=Mycena alexandri TaxID=1745969 RepID=A0AAD6T6G3_9AGAR|nr:hypothetical protein C8F04DRAFT_1254459 [Mycena alexandri]
MPLQNEQEEFVLFMLEDYLPSNPCTPCQANQRDCAVRTWGRACVSCERSLESTCFLLDPENWKRFYDDHGDSWDSNSFLGRDKYSYAELQEHVPAVFTWLRRCYFNRVRRHIKESLAKFDNPRELVGLFDLYAEANVGLSFMHLIADHRFSRSFMNSILDGIDLVLTGSPRHLLPKIAEATPRFAEISSMLIVRNPKSFCDNCVKLNRGCTFDCWAVSCRECDIALNPGCTFTSLEEFQDFAEADDKRTLESLKHVLNYGASITLEHYQSLYPILPAYFRATAVVSPFKTIMAYRNIIDSFDIQAIPALLDIGLHFGMSAELQNILLERMTRHNRMCKSSERVFLSPSGLPGSIVWDNIESAPSGISEDLEDLPALIDSSPDFGAI